MNTRPSMERRWYTSSRERRPGDIACPLLDGLYMPAWVPTCQRGAGSTCGECAAKHGPPGAQMLLPLDERRGIEHDDPLPW